MKKALILFTTLTLIPAATAYIDPGTGGMIAGSVWPFIIGIITAIGGFFVRYFFKPIKRSVKKGWEKVKRN